DASVIQKQKLPPSAGSFLLKSVKRNEPKKNAFPDKANPRAGSVRGFSDTASMPWRKTPHIPVRRPTGLETALAFKDSQKHPTLSSRAQRGICFIGASLTADPSLRSG